MDTAIDLNLLKEEIERLTKFHQIEILKIFNNYSNVTLNENNNGVFINLTNLDKNIIEELTNYLDYVRKQEKQLNAVEDEKNKLTNTFFKDNKDKDNNIVINA
jgi:hypothetical protein